MKNKNLFYIESLTDLYKDVQLNNIFSDSKFFVDSVPIKSTNEIMSLYNLQKTEINFNLKKFVEQHFILPIPLESTYSSATKNIENHLNDLWIELQRTPQQNNDSTLIPLPHPYIVPGGRFREIYYWDSYFTMLGLQVSKKIDLIKNMVDNFAYLIKYLGFIPNGNRTYYLGRSQPPFFALMVNILAEEKGNQIFNLYKESLETEYQFWMNGADQLSKDCNAINHVVLIENNLILNRYWDSKDEARPEAFVEDNHIAKKSNQDAHIVYRHIRAAAESGWDFSSRWFKDGINMNTIQTTDLIPIDLNCLILNLEETLLKIYKNIADTNNVNLFISKVENRKKAINNYCYNKQAGCFFDYNYIDKTQILHFNLATVFPLFFNIATNEQAKKIASLIKEKFLFDGGVVTTIYNTGQQWDAPNGWAPLQWIAYKGLKNYGFVDLANTIKNNWLFNCKKVFEDTGKMMEKYNVMDTSIKAGGGEYPNQDGFGWTNGVYLKLNAE